MQRTIRDEHDKGRRFVRWWKHRYYRDGRYQITYFQVATKVLLRVCKYRSFNNFETQWVAARVFSRYGLDEREVYRACQMLRYGELVKGGYAVHSTHDGYFISLHHDATPEMEAAHARSIERWKAEQRKKQEVETKKQEVETLKALAAAYDPYHTRVERGEYCKIEPVRCYVCERNVAAYHLVFGRNSQRQPWNMYTETKIVGWHNNGDIVCSDSRCRAVSALLNGRWGRTPRRLVNLLLEVVKNGGDNTYKRRLEKHFIRHT